MDKEKRDILSKIYNEVFLADQRRYKGHLAKITPSQIKQFYRIVGFKCPSCHQEKPLAIDHIIPRSKGGTDALSNLQPLCKRCNCTKGNKEIRFIPEWKEIDQSFNNPLN